VTCHFFVCTNLRPEGHPLPSCGRRGSAGVYEAFCAELARRGWPPGVKVTPTGCLTPCQHGPTVVVYPAGVWYGGVGANDVPELVAAHLDKGAMVTRLRLPDGVRLW
jgi:(2Fe-2S) ferredoxin